MEQIKLEKLTKSAFNKGLVTGIWMMVITICIIAFVCTWLSGNLLFLNEQEIPAEIQDIVDECANLSLFESAECTRDRIIPFYKYNISNVGVELNFSELKELGGVCSHWKDLYCFIGEKLGFNVEPPKIKTGKENRTIEGEEEEIQIMHTFCIWSDNNESGYVLCDQTSIFKFQFSQDHDQQIGDELKNHTEKELKAL